MRERGEKEGKKRGKRGEKEGKKRYPAVSAARYVCRYFRWHGKRKPPDPLPRLALRGF